MSPTMRALSNTIEAHYIPWAHKGTYLLSSGLDALLWHALQHPKPVKPRYISEVLYISGAASMSKFYHSVWPLVYTLHFLCCCLPFFFGIYFSAGSYTA